MTAIEPSRPTPPPLPAKITDAHLTKLALVAWGQLVIWADAEELGRLRRLRDHPRQNRLTHYPAELTRPKERHNEVPKGRQKKSRKRG